MLAPGAIPGLNSQQDWETRYSQGKLSGMTIMEAESVNKKEKKYIDDDFAREYSGISPSIAMRKIKKLEKKMYEHASNLEFEEASKIRDEIKKVKEFVFASNNQETAS